MLVDGEEALPRIAEAIADARSHVHIAGWCVTPDFAMSAGERPAILRELLADAARACPCACCSGAARRCRCIRVSRRVVRGDPRHALRGQRRSLCALDTHERPLHCHHEKLVIVDDELAFVGGIDLTDFAGNRLDRAGHPPRGALGWHDVATVLRGPPSATVARHFNLRWKEAAGERLPPPREPGRAGDEELQIVRTVPERIYDALPRGEFSILASYAGALRSAEQLVYLENQFLWSAEIVEILREKLRNPPSERFRLLLVLPAKPNSGADDTTGQLGLLADADDGAGRMLACTRYAVGDGRVRSRLRARQGRDRRRPLAHGRIGEPERALALQRHRDERRQPRPGARPRRRGCGSGRSTSRGRPRRSRATRRRSSTRSGGRSRPSSSSAGAAGAPLTHGLVRLRARLAPLQAPARAAAEPARRRLIGGQILR